MIIIRGLENLKEKYRNAVVTIGNFDGVHIGHQKIFRKVVGEAKAAGGVSMAITFDPHPVKVIAPEKGVRLLTDFNEKARLMEHYGLDVLLCINFDRDFSAMRPDDFIKDVIVGKVGAIKVIVGHNYAFGKGKKGNTELLRRRGSKYGFSFSVVRNARLHGEVVSSSKVRNLLTKGKVLEASQFLGRPYSIRGVVIRGAGRGGSLLKVPTANIEMPDVLFPKEGVYAVKVELSGEIFDGAANVGRNPTFGENAMTCEVHIFNFSRGILGEELTLYFIEGIRDEKKFPDIESLRENMLRDIERAGIILKGTDFKLVPN